MPTRDTTPLGTPCWTDLWTSDVAAARRFYCDRFGWEAEDPVAEFGGYFNFTRNGSRIAGCMGSMSDMPADNSWKIYLAAPDIAATAATAEAEGATIVAPPCPVGDLGMMTVLVDPTGAQLGLWQAGAFAGCEIVEEPGAPSWFELHTRAHNRAIAFYRTVFRWQIGAVSDTDDFRYFTVREPAGEDDMAGINDASRFLPEGASSRWSTYWYVADAQEATTRVKALGGTVVQGPEFTPYGVLATVTDPAGAEFRLRAPAS